MKLFDEGVRSVCENIKGLEMLGCILEIKEIV